MHITCISYVLHATPNKWILFDNPNILLAVQIMKHLIFQNPPILCYLFLLKAKYKNIIWNYFAFLVYLIYFSIFPDKLRFPCIYVIYSRISRNVDLGK